MFLSACEGSRECKDGRQCDRQQGKKRRRGKAKLQGLDCARSLCRYVGGRLGPSAGSGLRAVGSSTKPTPLLAFELLGGNSREGLGSGGECGSVDAGQAGARERPGGGSGSSDQIQSPPTTHPPSQGW